ncbi:MAG: hypothetical protein DWI03_06820 [Planctomycetota bacterium]|nr:MAG: hypothetical protein DWI03_06820 [Planctomycetota bacterium]
MGTGRGRGTAGRGRSADRCFASGAVSDRGCGARGRSSGRRGRRPGPHGRGSRRTTTRATGAR